MPDEHWGYGNPENAQPFDWALVGSRRVELLHGEHPHSRQDNNTYARFEGGSIEGFNGHRRCWRIVIETNNYLKESYLSGDEVRKGGSVQLFCDGEQIFEDFIRTTDRGFAVARDMIDRLSDVAGGAWLRAETRKELVGRKIFYDRTPAIIERVITDQGCLMIVPEEGHTFPAPVYEDNPEDWVSEYGKSIKTEVLSDRIWWWRR